MKRKKERFFYLIGKISKRLNKPKTIRKTRNNKKFVAMTSQNRKSLFLGHYNTEQEAREIITKWEVENRPWEVQIKNDLKFILENPIA